MNSSPARYYQDGDEYLQLSSRERSLRTLEGRYANDRPRDPARPNMHPDDDVADSDNNTADIFMSIAREDAPSVLPDRDTEQGSDIDESTVVSPVRLSIPSP